MRKPRIAALAVIAAAIVAVKLWIRAGRPFNVTPDRDR